MTLLNTFGIRQLTVIGLAFTLSACQTTAPYADQKFVSTQLNERSGYQLKDERRPGVFVMPEGVSFEDGLSEDETVMIALWNNSAFNEALYDLDIAHGDLVQAGLLPNPDASFAFEMPDKPFKYAIEFPIESLWLRPIRIKAMGTENDRIANQLVQSSLDLIRDVRQAYADTVLAQQRSAVSEEAKTLRVNIAGMAEKRLAAGDITQQEVGTAQIDALQATQDATRAAYDVPIATEKLRNLMGITTEDNITLHPSALPVCYTMDDNLLTSEALSNRPNALAAQKNVEAARKRLTLAKTGWIKLTGTADATSGKSGHELGPSTKFTLPIFNHNQGAVLRAEAEYNKALQGYETIKQQINMDVRQSYLQYQQICQEWTILYDQVRPQVENSVERTQKAYSEGDIAYLMVLESTRQLFDNHFRQAQLDGDLRRVWAQLERSVGRKIPTHQSEGTVQ